MKAFFSGIIYCPGCSFVFKRSEDRRVLVCINHPAACKYAGREFSAPSVILKPIGRKKRSAA